MYNFQTLLSTFTNVVNFPICRALVTGLSLGSTEVDLLDVNVSPDLDLVKPPSADLHVVAPSYITITVDPYKNW